MTEPAAGFAADDPRHAVARRTVAAGRLVHAVERWSPAAAARLAEGLFVRTARVRPRPDEAAWLKRATRRTLALGGQRIATYHWGDPAGPRVLCCHGWWSQAGRFLPIAEALRSSGHTVIAFDAPGHGRSSGWRASMPEFARTLRAVTDHYGPTRAVIGHSLGGAAALLASAGGLGTERIITVAAPADVTVWVDRFRDLLGLSAAVDQRMRDRMVARLGFTWDEIDVLRLAGGLKVPGLIVHDRDDLDVPIGDARRLAAAWPGATLFETAGLGHRRLLRDPAVIAAVTTFVADA